MSKSPGAAVIAEVDGPIRNRLAYHLSREGFRVVIAQDGEEAVAVAVADVALHVALVDLWMPRRDGMAVLRHMRRHCLAVPVVIIPAHATEAEIEDISGGRRLPLRGEAVPDSGAVSGGPFGRCNPRGRPVRRRGDGPRLQPRLAVRPGDSVACRTSPAPSEEAGAPDPSPRW